MKMILSDLFQGKRLEREEAKDILLKISEGKESDVQLASFLTVFRMRPITVDELDGFREALLQLAIHFQPPMDTLDIVGTGGDGKNTFNISTTSAFVIAGAGFPVSKHGNNSVSSFCGSSNVLDALGYTFTNNQLALENQLKEARICFLHAPLFHPAMRHVSNVRKQLGIKTFFNMLGPLVNPARPTYNVFGIYEASLGPMYQEILRKAGKRFKVVYDLNGYDEISLTGPVQVWDNTGVQTLTAQDFGLPACKQEALHGGITVEDARIILLNILEGTATEAQTNVVLANAALGIHCCTPEHDLKACVEIAHEAIHSGGALKTLETITNKNIL